MQQKFITVTFNRAKIALRCADILYVIMSDDHCIIHMNLDGKCLSLSNNIERIKEAVG